MSDFFADREWFALAFGVLLVAFASGLVLALRNGGNAVSRTRRSLDFLLVSAAWISLGFALFQRGVETGCLPVGGSFEIFQTLAWFAVFFVVFVRFVWALRVPVVFGTGVALVLCAAGFASSPTELEHTILISDNFSAGTPWSGVHAAFATIGYACFSGASMVWSIYLLQNSALRRRRTHRFFSKLPDLESLDRISGRLCAAGLVIFGMGVAIGAALLISGARLGSPLAVYKTIFSIAVSLGFLAILAARRKNWISAVKFARFGLCIFAFAVISLGGLHKAADFSREISEKTHAMEVRR